MTIQNLKEEKFMDHHLMTSRNEENREHTQIKTSNLSPKITSARGNHRACFPLVILKIY